MSTPIEGLGCVVIGRNEGERLRRCLGSLRAEIEHIVYVDSGSTDGSVPMAQGLGVRTVDLDMSVPFTAARARNAGFRALTEQHPDLAFVQFVDGDCEVVPGWLAAGVAALRDAPDVAAVAGRLRERHPEATVYNRLCDIEWNTEVGETAAVGGNAMMRAEAFRAVDGFDEGLIAGEEPELCLRLRRRGHRILRVDAEMALHDADMTRFGQWWQRARRSGHAYAEGAFMHGRSPERHYVREARRVVFWGAAVPLLALAGAVPTGGLSLALLGGYLVSAARVYRHTRRRGYGPADATLHASFVTLGKLPELLGLLRFHADRLRGRRPRIIDWRTEG